MALHATLRLLLSEAGWLLRTTLLLWLQLLVPHPEVLDEEACVVGCGAGGYQHRSGGDRNPNMLQDGIWRGIYLYDLIVPGGSVVPEWGLKTRAPGWASAGNYDQFGPYNRHDRLYRSGAGHFQRQMYLVQLRLLTPV